MAQGFIVPIPQPLFKANAAGAMVPAEGYKVYTYETNSTTPKVTYADGQLSSSNGLFVTADANGRFRMFVGQGVTVKCVIKTDTGAAVETYDYLQPMIPDPAAADSSAVPVGTSMWFAGQAAQLPSGYLVEDGSAVSRATFADLFAAISTTHGAGDGATTFNVPDSRGRSKYGQATAGTGSALGATFGAMDHLHTGPSHTHATTVPRDGWGQSLNNPTTTGRMATGYASGAGSFATAYQATGDQAITSAAGGTGNTGTSNPPGIVGIWMIKT